MKLTRLSTLIILVLAASVAFAGTEILIYNGGGTASIASPLPAGFVGPPPGFDPPPGGLGPVGGWDQGPFNFVLPGPGPYDLLIQIQDCCLVGDIYDPVLNGVDLGWTAIVPLGGPALSTGSFYLYPVPGGAYSLNVGDVLLSYIGDPAGDPWGGGVVPAIYSPAGFSMQVSYSTPEPGTLALLGSGILGTRRVGPSQTEHVIP